MTFTVSLYMISFHQLRINQFLPRKASDEGFNYDTFALSFFPSKSHYYSFCKKDVLVQLHGPADSEIRLVLR